MIARKLTFVAIGPSTNKAYLTAIDNSWKTSLALEGKYFSESFFFRSLCKSTIGWSTRRLQMAGKSRTIGMPCSEGCSAG